MLKTKAVNIALFSLYVLVVGIMVVCHEPWFDEAQSWLIARDLSPLEIIGQMRYEGHPFLYHYILMPFAKLGFPYITGNIISAIFCIISVAILLKKSPFNGLMKILILFSMPFMYYAFFARSYCLVVLAVVLLGAFYKEREERPIFYGILIFFLANTHAVMLGLAIMLVCTEYLYEIIFERKKYSENMLIKHYVGGSIACFGILITFFIALIAGMNNPFARHPQFTFLDLIEEACTSLSYIISGLTNNNILSVCFFISGIIFFIILFYEKNKKPFFIFLGAIMFFVAIKVFKYDLVIHTIISVMLILIFVFWIFCEKNTNLNYKKIITYISVSVMFLTNISLSYDLIKSDLLNNYSASYDTAEFINDNIGEDAKFICVADASSASIIPHLNKKTKFFSAITEQEFSFITFSHERELQLIEGRGGIGIKKIANAIKSSNKPVYFIYVPGWMDEEIQVLKDKMIFEEIYVNTTACETTENYEILKVNNEKI